MKAPCTARDLIYTVRAGFDIDIGYQSDLHHYSSQWLLGATIRWAP